MNYELQVLFKNKSMEKVTNGDEYLLDCYWLYIIDQNDNVLVVILKRPNNIYEWIPFYKPPRANKIDNTFKNAI